MATYQLRVNSINVLDKSNNITWASNADTFGVELSFDSLYDIPEGALVSLYINNKEHFRGVVLTKSDGRFVYSYKCLDFSHYLKNEVIKQFKNITASNAITSVLSGFGIKTNTVNMPTKINKWYIDETVEGIINDILITAGKDQQKTYYKEMQGATVVIGDVEAAKITPKIYVSADFTVDSSIEAMRNKIVVVNGKKVLATAQNDAAISLIGLMQLIETIDVNDKAKANALAKSTLKQVDKVTRSATLPLLVVDGFETIRANRKIEIKAGRINGWLKIKSATHTLVKGQHKISISVEW